MSELITQITTAYRSHAAVGQKARIGLVSEVLGPSDWETGFGDDGAVVPVNSERVVVGGEAIFPPFVEQDPRAAGFAAILANVNDLAAMGAEPSAIVNTVVGEDALARLVLEGMRDAAEMYQVPIVGGHLTVRVGPPAVSAFGIGTVQRPLSVRNVADGQVLMLACALEGTMREDFPFFGSFNERRDRMAGDVRLLAELATSGRVRAAKDVSMAGLLGSLAMLLEARRAGATVDVARIPVPPGVDIGKWVIAFPAFSFLLCVEEEHVDGCRASFAARDLTCAELGRIDTSGQLRLCDGDLVEVIHDFSAQGLTNIAPI